MNLLEHYIIQILSVEDCTDEFVEYMKKDHPDFEANEPFVCVELLADCYGRVGKHTRMWKKSEFEKIKEIGYFMG